MKKFKLFGLALILLSVTGCMDRADPEETLIGRWKLVRGETVFFEPRTVNYSSHNIVYYFQPDGTFTVESDLEDFIGHSPGQYTYRFNPSPAFNGYDMDYTLQIGGTSWACSISRNKMILDRSPLDGSILSFIKL